MRVYADGNDRGNYTTFRFPKGVASAAQQAGSGAAPVTQSQPNPLSVNCNFDGAALSPALNVTRNSYTVPKNRRAQLQNARVSMDRVAAGGPNASSLVYVGIYRVNNPAVLEVVVLQQGLLNAVGNELSESTGFGNVDLFSGDQVVLVTSDASVGGTVHFNLGTSIVEFDSSLPQSIVQSTGAGIVNSTGAGAVSSGGNVPFRPYILGSTNAGSGPINTNGFII